MTQYGAAYFMDKHMEEMAKLSMKAGVYGVVAPGNKPAMINKIRKMVGSKMIISPGIGAQGGDPATAIKNGADYVIVGRTICQSKDPSVALNEINRSIESLDLE